MQAAHCPKLYSNDETTQPHNQDVICVLGMHRSGTSLLTRILNLISVELGARKELTTMLVSSNPRGYWEHHGLTAVSVAILKRHGGSWDKPPTLLPGWEKNSTINDLRHQGQALILKQFSGIQTWG